MLVVPLEQGPQSPSHTGSHSLAQRGRHGCVKDTSTSSVHGGAKPIMGRYLDDLSGVALLHATCFKTVSFNVKALLNVF